VWRQRQDREPVLIVIDEAHNVCPAEPRDELGRLAAEHVVRIAAEGRKFGLHLLLCTQRPQKVPENALSQCDNLVLMRLNSRADAAFAQEAFSFVPAGLLALAPDFALGQALIAGPIARAPLVVRFGGRVSREGGGDVAHDWAAR
jgi:DNA helicase HerA-like ATPase